MGDYIYHFTIRRGGFFHRSKYVEKNEIADIHYVPNSNGTGHYEACAGARDLRKMQRFAAKKRLNLKYYPAKYRRDVNCKRNYLAIHRDRSFRCVYCGKKFNRSDITVDHLVPLNKARNSVLARFMLMGRDVNGDSNLVPACMDCNRKKSDHLFPWIFQGFLGQFETYWVMVWCIRTVLFLAAVIAVVSFLQSEAGVYLLQTVASTIGS